jgi:hypothetical protein
MPNMCYPCVIEMTGPELILFKNTTSLLIPPYSLKGWRFGEGSSPFLLLFDSVDMCYVQIKHNLYLINFCMHKYIQAWC